MQIELLETFLDLVETGSFNRTAERLSVTQSTVSGRVRSLEASLGARLFVRSKAGTSTTGAGQRFAAHAMTMVHEWNEAKRTMKVSGDAEQALHVGMQNDLAASHIGEWVSQFRKALPQTSFYIEPDYSNQMCQDLLSGTLDVAVLYTPRHLPDIHYEMIGEVSYAMVSTHCTAIGAVDRERYVLASYSPAFTIVHRQALPQLAQAPVSCGQNATICALLGSLGGSAFVLEDAAREMTASGKYHWVSGVEPISQPVFFGVHVRNRHKPSVRKLASLSRKRFLQR